MGSTMLYGAVRAQRASWSVLTRCVSSFTYGGRVRSAGRKPCVCCCGILQPDVMTKVADQIVQTAKEFDHDNLVRLIVSLPPAASIIRQRAMEMHVEKNVGASAMDRPVMLRQGAKFALGPTIESALGVRLLGGVLVL
mmetsp:Transcript_10133/g.30988  ORF Transcript_10133/g.30988 Transcript_10133/m.30988 type:complete len:138 (-) Transcript_10133:1414-1827(-)